MRLGSGTPTAPQTPDVGSARPSALSGRSRWHLQANAPVVFWLLALVAVAIGRDFVAAAPWLLVHLLLLGALTNAILVWSAHFTDALLRRRPGRRRAQAARLVSLNVGVVAVVVGVVADSWLPVLAGAIVVGAAVAAHGIALTLQSRRALPSRFGATVRYYIAASLLLPIGAGLGAALAHSPSASWHDRLVLAHAAINLLGFVGLTVTGTLVTLWPTMLRTRIADGAERAARITLPVILVAVAVIVAGAVAGQRLLAAAGVLAYLGGLVVAGRPFVRAARDRAPSAYATWSVLAAVAWFAGSLVALTTILVVTPSWTQIADRINVIALPLVAGFAAQVLFGALSYLAPVVLGGGPHVTRRTVAVLNRIGALRIVVINAALVVASLPTPRFVHLLTLALAVVGLASFLPLLGWAVREAHRLKASAPLPGDGPRPRFEPAPVVRGRHTGMALVGLTAVVLAVAGGVALNPSALKTGGTVTASAGITATGQTTTVKVSAHDMRFFPASVSVPAGNRLVIEVTNTDTSNVHDLTLETGQATPRLAPGASARLDVGIVGRSLTGWCSVTGHRQMGMVFAVKAIGGPATSAGGVPGQHDMSAGTGGGATGPSAASALDFLRTPPAGFQAHDARLSPAPAAKTHRLTLTVTDVEREVAPGVRQTLWVYNGTAPGPTLRGKVGDTFVITLVNHGTMGHSIDFHAGSLAPDRPMRTIPPGGQLVYRFTATHSGAWLYHCSTMPMSVHIANGMFGAVIIDPPDLPRVDREYVLVTSEFYLGAQGGTADAAKLAAEKPDLFAFNGYADQYDHQPLTAKVGERVRIWLVAAGPDRGTAFHVVGAQFDTVFKEGAWLLRPDPATRGASQVLDLAPAQGGFVELTFPEAGHYPFVDHAMTEAERGAHGIITVTR